MASNSAQEPIDVDVFQHEDKTWEVTLEDAECEPVILTGATILAVVRKRPKSAILITMTTTIVDAAGGVFRFGVVPDDTADESTGGTFPGSGCYVYDVYVLGLAPDDTQHVAIPLSGFLVNAVSSVPP